MSKHITRRIVVLVTGGALALWPSVSRAAEIHEAVQAGDAAQVSTLLEQGADTNARDAAGKTPLQLAIDAGNADVVASLLEKSQAGYTDTALSAGEPADAAQLLRCQDMLSTLVREKPDNERINFAFGLVCLSLQEYGKAQLAFERVLAANPGNDRARFELARALMANGQTGEARHELESVLSHKPPAAIETRVLAYLDDLRHRSKRWHASVRGDVGWLHDDNANVGPDAAVVPIAPVIFGGQEITSLAVSKESRPANAEGVFAAASVAGAYDAGDPGGWVLVTDAKYYESWLRGASDFDALYLQADGGVKHASRRSVSQATLEYSHSAIGDSTLVDTYGLRPAYLRVSELTKNLTWLTPALVEYRDYRDLNDWDGPFVSLGESLRYALNGGKQALSMGVLVFHDFTDADVYEHTGITWRLGAETDLMRWARAYAIYRYTDADYKERETLAPEKRSDTQQQVATGLSATIMPRWGLDVQYQFTQNDSTFALYEYRRNVTTLSTWVTF
jgi:outer membrane protein